jgi:polysaccharide biosynthesis/export protein
MAPRAILTKVAVPLLILGILAGCHSSAGTGTTTGTTTGAAQNVGALPPPQVLASIPNAAQVEYHIGPLDLLDISVFQVPDLTQEARVDAQGQISMPLIGVVQAAGKTVPELEKEIKTKLEAKYLQSAQVTVFVKEANSQQVTVDGAVAKPGMVTLNGPTTLLQTVAMSGGLAKNANPHAIVVFRTVDQKRMAAKFDLASIRKGQAQDPVLYGGDIVVVDSSAFGSALSAITSTLPIFGVFNAVSTVGGL